MDIKYKFNEKKNLDDLTNYINKTYGQHYSAEKFQVLEVIEQQGPEYAKIFCHGNMIKYITRLGKKNGWNTDDLMKVLHYGILLLYFGNTEENNKK